MRRLRRTRRLGHPSEHGTHAFGTPSASTCSLPCDAERGDHAVCRSAVVCPARRADRSGRHRLDPITQARTPPAVWSTTIGTAVAVQEVGQLGRVVLPGGSAHVPDRRRHLRLRGSSAGLAAIRWCTRPPRTTGHRRGEHVPVPAGGTLGQSGQRLGEAGVTRSGRSSPWTVSRRIAGDPGTDARPRSTVSAQSAPHHDQGLQQMLGVVQAGCSHFW